MVAIVSVHPAGSWGCWPWGGQQGFTRPAPPCSQTEILSLSPLCLARPSSSSRPASGLLRPNMLGRQRVTRRCAQASTGHDRGRTRGLMLFFFCTTRWPVTLHHPPTGAPQELLSLWLSAGLSWPCATLWSTFISDPDLPLQHRAMCGAFSTAAVRAGAQGPARTKCSVSVEIAEKQELKKKLIKKRCSSTKVLSASPRGRAETRISAVETPESVFKAPL